MPSKPLESRVVGDVTIGIWQEKGVYWGLIKEFSILGEGATLKDLIEDLSGAMEAYLVAFVEIYLEKGTRAKLFCEAEDEDEDWSKAQIKRKYLFELTYLKSTGVKIPRRLNLPPRRMNKARVEQLFSIPTSTECSLV